MRRVRWVRRQLALKPETDPESVDVDATVISVKVLRLTRGDLAICPELLASQGAGMDCQKSAEAIVAVHREQRRAEPAKERIEGYPSAGWIEASQEGSRLGVGTGSSDDRRSIQRPAGEQSTERSSPRKREAGTAGCGTACPVVWEDGGGNLASYPIKGSTFNVGTAVIRFACEPACDQGAASAGDLLVLALNMVNSASSNLEP